MSQAAGQPRFLTLGELYRTPDESSQFVVQDILPPGLLLFVAGPKQGKTRLMLQVAAAVADGGVALGRFQCQRAPVLYFALEDGFQRIKRTSASIGLRPSNDLLISDTLPVLDADGRQHLEAALDSVKGVRLVIIDVLNRVMPRVDSGRGAYHDEAAALVPLQELAAEREIAVVLVHHTNKNPDAPNPLLTINGTQALAGTADNLWFLSRDAKTNSGHLQIMGRDVREQTIELEFDPVVGSWTQGRPTPVTRPLIEDKPLQAHVEDTLTTLVGYEWLPRPLLHEAVAEKHLESTTASYLERVTDNCLKNLVKSGRFEKQRVGRQTYFRTSQLN